MLELGDESPKRHAELAEAIEAARIDLVFCAGPLMQSLWEALSPTRRGGYALEAAELEPRLARAVEPGDVVMVKGSRDSKAQALAKALMALDVSAGKVG
jgi:UDP-N-acetylmuramoyl-tripeptide--D-alanyl-D-alanine ligase